jgi:hypothetical protein
MNKAHPANPPRNPSRERVFLIGELIVQEVWERFLVVQITGNLDLLRDMEQILGNAMEQVGNCIACAKRFRRSNEKTEGQGHE